MKLLVLSIFNDECPFMNEMKKENVIYLNEISRMVSLDYYYITLKEMEHDYEIDEMNKVFYVKGANTVVPGLLYKTLKSIEILINELNKTYDYILRTNSSTVIDFVALFNFLKTLDTYENENYLVTSQILQLHWIDVSAGIIDDKYHGTIYPTGRFILMRSSAWVDIVANQNKLDFSIIDDVSLGIYLHHPCITRISLTNFVEDDVHKIHDLNNLMIKNCVENKDNRILDVYCFKFHIYRLILKYRSDNCSTPQFTIFPLKPEC
jgi:hypothetical protein